MIVLRAIGDGSQLPGDIPTKGRGPNVSLTPPPAYDAFVAGVVDAPHNIAQFAPVEMPKDATSVMLAVNRPADADDAFLYSAYIDVSIDGGATYGGAFRYEVKDFDPVSYSLENSATFGPDVGMGDFNFGALLPPDQGQGRFVRFSVGAKAPQDVGVYYDTDATPYPPLGQSHHSVAFDVGANPGSYNGATSLSWSHAGAASPTNYLAIVTVAWTEFGGSGAVPVIKWDTAGTNTSLSAIASTLNTSAVFQGSLKGRTELWSLTSPTAGTVTVGITVGGGGTGIYGKGVCSSTWTGASGSFANATVAGATSTAPSVTVPSTAASSYVQDAMAFEQGAGAAVSSNNRTLIVSGTGAGGQGGGSQYAAGSGSVAMSWVISASCRWLASGVEILQSGGGGGTFKPAFANQNGQFIGVGVT